jgi:hypothetical protein
MQLNSNAWLIGGPPAGNCPGVFLRQDGFPFSAVTTQISRGSVGFIGAVRGLFAIYL